VPGSANNSHNAVAATASESTQANAARGPTTTNSACEITGHP
jgi:hypothetical protein